jgi:predicted Fe-Mo cluster-binding NifX family protein
MRIAMPVANGTLCLHFGHAPEFALIDTDPESRKVLRQEIVAAPPHEPGLLPRWLAQQGANVILAGGMGARAQGLFTEAGIRVVTGAPSAPPEQVAEAFLAGTLQVGKNVCDH